MREPEASALLAAELGYLTTTGRTSGHSRTVEIWFAWRERTIYMLADGRERTHWVRNILASPAVSFRVNHREIPGRGRIVTDPAEQELAARLLIEKYQPGHGEDLSRWGVEALPVAVDLELDLDRDLDLDLDLQVVGRSIGPAVTSDEDPGPGNRSPKGDVGRP